MANLDAKLLERGELTSPGSGRRISFAIALIRKVGRLSRLTSIRLEICYVQRGIIEAFTLVLSGICFQRTMPEWCQLSCFIRTHDCDGDRNILWGKGTQG